MVSFDAGSAMMSMMFQAQKMGLATHAMGGFDAQKALEWSKLDSKEYQAMCVVAIGYQGSVDDLQQEFKDREVPSSRKSLDKVYTLVQ
ncbi:MAG: nitroreductase family protein [Bdellovibrionota bacterium]